MKFLPLHKYVSTFTKHLDCQNQNCSYKPFNKLQIFLTFRVSQNDIIQIQSEVRTMYWLVHAKRHDNDFDVSLFLLAIVPTYETKKIYAYIVCIHFLV
jgi:hypothetical protein